jgi:restriction endonuclease Mrr
LRDIGRRGEAMTVQDFQMMIDHGEGVTEVATYTLKKADADYFENE